MCIESFSPTHLGSLGPLVSMELQPREVAGDLIIVAYGDHLVVHVCIDGRYVHVA
jgi:hypothetical protein